MCGWLPGSRPTGHLLVPSLAPVAVVTAASWLSGKDGSLAPWRSPGGRLTPSQSDPVSSYGSVMRRALPLLLPLLAGARADEASQPPVAAQPALSFISRASSGAGEPPGTVSPSTTSEPPSPQFRLALRDTGNDGADQLEIVQNDVANAPRVSFEALTDRTSWDVTKWEDPLTQIANMLKNENVSVPEDSVRIAVQLDDPVSVVNVSFTKVNPWYYGPTLVLGDLAFEGLTKLKYLAFTNFNMSFDGSRWLPTNTHLKTLSFTKITLDTFAFASDYTVADAQWRDSSLQKFPSALLTLKNLPQSLTISACTFAKPFALTSIELAALKKIPSVTMKGNVFPAANAADCSTTETFQENSVCVTTPAEDKGTTTVASEPSPSTSSASSDTIPPQSPSSDRTASSSNGYLRSIVAILCIVGGIALVAGFVLFRRKKHPQEDQLTLTRQNDKFIVGEEDEILESGIVRGTAYSQRTTAVAGALSEWDLGRNAISGESRLGPNGLWRADHRGAAVAAIRVNVESLRERGSDTDSVVASCVALRHPYVVEFLGSSLVGTDEIWLVAEFMAKGSLRSAMLKKKIELTWEKVRTISLHVASALAFIQSVRAPTATVTPTLSARSVLCDSDLNCKLDVFEFAEATRTTTGPVLTYGQGEIAVRAPELLTSRNASNLPSSEAAAAEVYALGVLFCELTHQKPLYSDILEERGNTLGEIFVAQEVMAGRLRPEPSADTPDEYARIIAACVAYHPDSRPALSEVVEWLTHMEL